MGTSADTTTKPPNRLRELREKASEKPYDLAALIRKDTATIYRYETGETRIPEDLLRFLCSHYDVTAEYLLGWDRDTNGEAAA